VTDTVGSFETCEDLIAAFRSTFDELRESHLLIHLVT